jgi:predicted short-subunit dehydrogenase-like oxidoreductase (DUF2520 family)
MFHEEAVPSTASATVAGRARRQARRLADLQPQQPAERRWAAQGHLHTVAEQPRDAAAGIAAVGGGGWPAEPRPDAQLAHPRRDHR